ncbi:MAG TPA: glutathione S-transferase family protein [Solirubrobacterales bacterium]|nr:glutathione S-transferase family protein [Solirubrobacterales bacterium]
MEGLTLVIGNRNYSSWSMRVWVLMRQLGIGFEEVQVPLGQADSLERKLSYSPAGKVPVLIDGDTRVWDSLAIAEHLAERFPDKPIWPDEDAARALARSVSAEMHSGFPNLRSRMPLNCRARRSGAGPVPEVREDVDRIREIWRECRARHGDAGPFLFGGFTAADAMFAPVVSRFQTYGVELDGVEEAYAQTILELPAVGEWIEGARKEPWDIPLFDQALRG